MAFKTTVRLTPRPSLRIDFAGHSARVAFSCCPLVATCHRRCAHAYAFVLIPRLRFSLSRVSGCRAASTTLPGSPTASRALISRPGGSRPIQVCSTHSVSRSCREVALKRGLRDSVGAQDPRGRADRGASDTAQSARRTHRPAEIIGAHEAPGQAAGSAGPRRKVSSPRHGLQGLLSHRGARATNILRVLLQGPTPVGDPPPHPRVEAGPVVRVGQSWRRPSPPSGRTVNRRNRGGPAAEAEPAPLHPHPCLPPFQEHHRLLTERFV